MPAKLTHRFVPAGLVGIYALAVLTAQPVAAQEEADPFAGLYPSPQDFLEARESAEFPQVVKNRGRAFLVFRPRVVAHGIDHFRTTLISSDGRKTLVTVADSKRPVKLRVVEYDVPTGSNRQWFLPEGYDVMSLVEVDSRFYGLLDSVQQLDGNMVVRFAGSPSPRPLMDFKGEYVEHIGRLGNQLVVVTDSLQHRQAKNSDGANSKSANLASRTFLSRLFDANDRLVGTHSFAGFSDVWWDELRGKLVLNRRMLPTPDEVRDDFQFFFGDPVTGSLEPAGGDDFLPSDKWWFTIAAKETGGAEGKSLTVVWLTDSKRLSHHEFPVVEDGKASKDLLPLNLGDAPLLSSLGKVEHIQAKPAGFLLLADRMVWFVPTTEVPVEQFERMSIAIESRRLMFQAGEVAYALMRFAASNDGVLPPGDRWQDYLAFFLEDQRTMLGFNYTGAGQDTSLMANRKDTVIGVLVGKHGRVLVFADGRLRWESLRPSSVSFNCEQFRRPRFPVDARVTHLAL